MSIEQANELTIALSRGRILDDSLPLLDAAGVGFEENLDECRKLVLKTIRPDVKLLVLRAFDVPTFVANGAADIGIAGKDVLIESDVSNFYETLDLHIACCRLVRASQPNADLNKTRLKIATKYAQIARTWHAEQGLQVEVIKLYGSMELAPLVGLADAIVDIVKTGNTLKANGLVVRDQIMDISARLIINRASMKMKPGLIKPMIKQIAAVVTKGRAL